MSRYEFHTVWIDRNAYAVRPKERLINVSVSMFIDGLDVDRAIELIRESAKDLTDPIVSIEIEDNYGDRYTATCLHGWRPMKDEEWEAYESQLKERKEREREARLAQKERDLETFLKLKAKFEPKNGIKSTSK